MDTFWAGPMKAAAEPARAATANFILLRRREYVHSRSYCDLEIKR